MRTPTDTFERRHSVLRTRREWSVAEKRLIVAETRAAGANISAIARRHGAAQSLVYQWRKLFAAVEPERAFLPVAVIAPPVPSEPLPTAARALIEIELASGRKLRVASDVDATALQRIVAALEAT